MYYPFLKTGGNGHANCICNVFTSPVSSRPYKPFGNAHFTTPNQSRFMTLVPYHKFSRLQTHFVTNFC